MKKNEILSLLKDIKKIDKNRGAYFDYYTQRDLTFLLKYFKKKAKVLDVGGGAGRIAIPLAEKGFDVTIEDPVEQFLEIAEHKAFEENLGVKTVVCGGEKMNFNGSFDAVIAMRDVLNYCNDYEKVFSKMVKACKKNGIIVCSVGSVYNGIFREIKNKNDVIKLYDSVVKRKRMPSGEGFDYARFSVADIENLFIKSNLKILEVSGDSIMLPLVKKRIKTFDEQTIKKIKELDYSLSKTKNNLNFFDHIIAIGRKN